MKKIFAILGIILFGILLYGSVIKGVIGNVDLSRATKLTAVGQPFESSHEKSPYATLLSIVNSHSVALSKPLADFGAPDVGYYKGKFYSLFPPGISISAVPFFIIGSKYNLNQLFVYSMIGLYSVASLVFLFLICKDIFGFSIKKSLLGTLIFAVGTSSLCYATSIYQHLPTVFFILTSFYFAYKYKTSKWPAFIWGILSAGFCGISIFLDYPNAFFSLPVLIYLFFSSFRIEKTEQKTTFGFRFIFLFAAIAFLATLFVHGYFNKITYGNWSTTPQSGGFERYNITNLKALQAPPSKSNNTEKKHSTSFSIPFREQYFINGLTTLTLENDKGILFYSPIVIFGIFGIFISFKKFKVEYAVLASIVCINFLMYGSFPDPWGGWSFGPRYLIPGMSVLSIFTISFFSFISKKRFSFLYKIPFFLVAVYSTAVTLLGALTTNVIPPVVEAIPLKLSYGLTASIAYLNSGLTGTFVFKYFLFRYLNLLQFYEIILGVVAILLALLIFIPERSNNNES